MLHNSFANLYKSKIRTNRGGYSLIKAFVGILVLTVLLVIDIDFAAGHLIGSNVVTKIVGKYEVRFQAFPLYPNTERPTTLGFSVLDSQGYNVWNMEADVKVQKDGNMVFASPKTKHEISDFFIEYLFPEKGRYDVILEASIPEEPQVITADFVLVIGQDVDSNGLAMIVLTGGVVGGVTGALFLMRRSKSSKGLRTG